MTIKTPRFPASLILLGALSCLNVVIGVSDARAVQLYDGLIGYWNLNGNASDTAPNGTVADNGEVRNSPPWLGAVDGKFGAGVQFNGTSQGILVPASSDLNIGTTGVTVSAWVRLDTLPGGLPAPVSPATNTFGAIYDADADSYVLYLDRNANELRFKATTTNNQSSSPHAGVPSSMLDTTNWHHVMGTFDGSPGNGASKIYFDGNLVDISSVNTTAGGLVKTGQIAGIGAQPGTGAGNPFGGFLPGSVADVAVWNRTLGAAEAQYLYNGGAGNAVGAANPDLAPLALVPVQPAVQPVIYYAFDGNLNNSGTGGAAYNAVLQDDPARNNPLFTPTPFGQGLDLRDNGNEVATTSNGDYLSVNYTLPDSGTIELNFTADEFYDHLTLWSNSVHGNAWESWIYGNGRLAARANEGASADDLDFYLPIVGNPDPDAATYHIAYTWERNGSKVSTKLYIDGVLREQATGNWKDPGTTFFIGGGVPLAGTANDLGSGIFDEFRIYNVALTAGEVLYLSQVPEPASLALVGCGLAFMAIVSGGRSRQRRAVNC
jgi:hypothetical protein